MEDLNDAWFNLQNITWLKDRYKGKARLLAGILKNCKEPIWLLPGARWAVQSARIC